MPNTLRPLSLGELLDRSFFLYRSHFGLFLGVVALPHLVLLAFQLLEIPLRPKTATGIAVTSLLLGLGFIVIYLAVIAASQAATVIAVSRVHLDQTTSISEVFAAIRGRILEISLIMIGVGIGVGMGLILLVIPGIFLALMWSLTIPVAVLEETGLRDSVARSAELTKGSRGRIFVIYLLYSVLFYTLYLLFEFPLGIAIIGMARQHQLAGGLPVWVQVAAPVATFIPQCLLAPLLTIALSLVYYDQRVRKEAFDLQHMMTMLDHGQGGAAGAALV